MPITIEQWKQKNLEGSGFTREQQQNPDLPPMTMGDLMKSKNDIIKSGELGRVYDKLEREDFVAHVQDGKTIVKDMSDARKEMHNDMKIIEDANKNLNNSL